MTGSQLEQLTDEVGRLTAQVGALTAEVARLTAEKERIIGNLHRIQVARLHSTRAMMKRQKERDALLSSIMRISVLAASIELFDDTSPLDLLTTIKWEAGAAIRAVKK
jgi:hypothetical protein